MYRGGDTVKAHKAAGRKTDWIIRVVIAALLAAVLIKGLQLLMQVNAKQAELSQLAPGGGHRPGVQRGAEGEKR